MFTKEDVVSKTLFLFFLMVSACDEKGTLMKLQKCCLLCCIKQLMFVCSNVLHSKYIDNNELSI